MTVGAPQTLEDLKARGREWRRRFSEVEFIGELEISEREVVDVCRLAGKYLSNSWNEDFCAALAVAVVNLAYYASAEIGDSFRWQVLERLGYPDNNTQLWEHRVGAPTLRVLEKYFGEADVPGPHRYVRPIMRQAGVPARLVNRFAAFFLQLTEEHGWPVTETEYMEFCRTHETGSAMLDNFLRTRAGWRYCCDVARALKSQTAPSLTAQPSPSAFRGGLVERIRQKLDDRQRSALRGGQPVPKLVLDRDELRLALRFPERGLNSYRWSDGRRVLSAIYRLKDDDLAHAPRGTFQKRPGQPWVPWVVQSWDPSRDRWALFHPGSGTYLQSSGVVRPGRYLLALPEDCFAKLDGFYKEYEDCGYLVTPAACDQMFKVVDCELSRGIQLREIGLTVLGETSREAPFLTFTKEVRSLPHCPNVFAGELPAIEIGKWSEGFADRFIIIADYGADRVVIPPTLYEKTNVFNLPGGHPAQGTLLIEPRGRSPRGFEEAELPFVLLPRGAGLAWPSGLREYGEDLTVAFHPAADFQVSWEEVGVRPAEGAWHVPPGLQHLTGQVVHQGGATFPVSGAIDRFDVRGAAVERGILWSSRLRGDSDIRLSLSEEECGRHVDLGICDGGGFIRIADGVGPVSKSCQLTVKTSSIRDAFEDRPHPAGRLSVRLYGSKVVRSEVTYLNEKEIVEHLFDDVQSDFEPWIGCVPAGLCETLRALRALPAGESPSFAYPTLDVPEPLAEFVNILGACRNVFDCGEGATALTGALPPPLKTFLRWFVEAREYVGSPDVKRPREAKALLDQMPRVGAVASALYRRRWGRWRGQVAAVVRALRASRCADDLRRTIQAWSRLCREQRWEGAGKTNLGSAPGGQALTGAAHDYFHALRWRAEGNLLASNQFFYSANAKLEAVAGETPAGIVREMACALGVMVYFHLRHPGLNEKAAQAVQDLGDHWQRYKNFIRVACDVEAPESDAEGTVRLGDFSPHVKDAEIEEMIFHD